MTPIQRLTDHLILKQYIPSEDREIYEYGFDILIYTVWSTLALLFIGFGLLYIPILWWRISCGLTSEMLFDNDVRITDWPLICFSTRTTRNSSDYNRDQYNRTSHDSVNNPSEQVLSRTQKKALNYTLYHHDTFRSGSRHTREHIP